MEGAIQTVVKVFLKSSKGKERLGKKEFQTLVKSELCNVLTDTDSKEAINNMGQGLDADKDGRIGFEEYMKLVGWLAVSLSEQRSRAQEEAAQNASSEPVAQSAPGAEATKPEATKPEATKPEANADAKPAPEVKAGGKLEVKAEGAAQPQEPTAAAVAAAAAEVVVKEEIKVEVTETVVEAVKEEAEPEAQTEATS
ncbi:S100 calcium binding protein U isoform X1 [Betta splendens]|uniref:S100 calcium binding protein U isoform X1 n=1 Tax=Betta splendens TaxID=158456 RepID=A0A6P7P195_BETSP|nr:S100 calcium binding protein U isoform X1 [Betta splendens]XP_029023871.1 S100 calcium binding protein U isoform X1 [Betta splendens]